eukprot:378440-Pleurochrysis_carterae.AAC.1
MRAHIRTQLAHAQRGTRARHAPCAQACVCIKTRHAVAKHEVAGEMQSVLYRRNRVCCTDVTECA